MHNRIENNRLFLIKSDNANCSDGNSSSTSSCDDTVTSDEQLTKSNYLNLADYSRLSKTTSSNLDTIHLTNLTKNPSAFNNQLTIKNRHLYNSVGNLASTDQLINLQQQQALLNNDQNNDLFTCRVQYLNDLDAFSLTTLFPEPSRPPLFQFNVNMPLVNQLAAVHRLLNAPHRVIIKKKFLNKNRKIERSKNRKNKKNENQSYSKRDLLSLFIDLS